MFSYAITQFFFVKSKNIYVYILRLNNSCNVKQQVAHLLLLKININ